MRKPVVLLAFAALAAPFAATATAGDDDAPVRAAKTRTVRVEDNFFRPGTIKVKKGTVVKWVWGARGESETDFEHNVRGRKGQKFKSKVKTRGSFRKRIKKTTSIVCDVHFSTMRMKIKVKK